MPQQFIPSKQIHVTNKWDLKAIFGKGGVSGVRHFEDVDNDGTIELVTNIGAQAHFAAVKPDGTIQWENIQDTTRHTFAYTPQVADGAFFYGDRSSDTVYAIELSDGTLRWSATVSGDLEALDQSDIGIVYGSTGTSGETGVLDTTDGSQKSGWPVSFAQNEQRIGAFDLDGDGQDEFVLNDANKNLEVRNRDGSLKWSETHNAGHIDRHYEFTQADGTTALLTILNKEGDIGGGEGDEITLFDADGTRLDYTVVGFGPAVAVADLDGDGEDEIIYSIETNGDVGVLNNDLSERWTTSIPTNPGGAAGGQLWLADWDGDGDLEIFCNTGEGPSDGFCVFNVDGSLQTTVLGNGWDSRDEPTHGAADPTVKQHSDIDGDGRDEVYPGYQAGGDTADSDGVIVQTMHYHSDW